MNAGNGISALGKVCMKRPDMCLAKRTRRREFLDEMDRVVPWSDLMA